MSQKVVVALYDHYADARAAVSDIMQAGIPGGDIALLANDSNGDHPGLSINPAYAREQFDEDSQKQSRFVTLGEVGIGLGGLLGFLTTISPVPIPGVDGNPIWIPIAAGAVIGGIIGVVIGLTTGHGVTSGDALLYTEGLKRGGTLVTAHVPEASVAKTREALKKRNPAKLEDRPGDWTAEGWVSLDVGHADGVPAGGLAPA
jgi:hypothetical protein